MIKPLGERVVVKVSEQAMKTASGIVLPDTAKEKPQGGASSPCGRGQDVGVRQAGADGREERRHGSLREVFGNEVKVDNEDYLIIRQSDVQRFCKTRDKRKSIKFVQRTDNFR